MGFYILVGGVRPLCDTPMHLHGETCGHMTRASAEAAAERLRRNYFAPGVLVEVREGVCPAYARDSAATAEMWEDE